MRQMLLWVGLLVSSFFLSDQPFSFRDPAWVASLNPAGAAAAPAAWYPTNISGCTFWLAGDQSQLSTSNNGDYIQTWYDNSGNAFDVSAATAPYRPVYLTSVQNGKPGVWFAPTGAVQRIIRSSFDLTSIFQTNDYSFFCVWSNVPDANDDYMFNWVPNSSSNENFVSFGSSFLMWQHGVHGGEGYSFWTHTPFTNRFYMVSLLLSNQASAHAWTNNTAFAADTTVNSNFWSASATLTIGGKDNNSGSCILEMIGFNRCLTPAEHTQVRSNLNAKYALW